MIRKLRKVRWGILLLLSLYTLQGGIASALQNDYTQSQLYQLGIGNYDVDACGSGATGDITVSSAEDTALNLTAAQVTNAQAIIGIAKTENLGQQGAIIAIMVALDESNLKIYANSTVPLSLNNPNKQDVGSNGSSLGLFQQQITKDWSTISSDPGNQQAVNQLMNPAYSAEAFFGSPPGSNAPPELSKGLQNKSGWQSMQPWVAAQAVQASATLDGSNYKAEMASAQQIVKKYYDNSPEIPLPVALTGGKTASGGGSTGTTADSCDMASSVKCTTSQNTASAQILCAAQKYAGIYYEYGGGHQGYDAYKSGCPDPAQPPDNQPTGGPSIAGGEHGNPSPCAIDCSALISMAVDDAFSQTFSWVVADFLNSPDWEKISGYSNAQPGDIVTQGTDHVEIFVSYDSTHQTVATFGAHHTGVTTGPTTAQAGYYDGIYRYIGPGSGH